MIANLDRRKESVVFLPALFWFLLCCCMAGLEIEAEGKYGWAERMPTWYRTTGRAARMFAGMTGGKPLTGYHVFVSLLPLLMVHVPFVSGATWSPSAELSALAMYFVVVVLWDYLWFVFNPAYGTDNFSRGNVWWHAKSPWVFGLFPVDYLYGTVASIVLSAGSAWFADDLAPLTGHLVMLWWLAVFTAVGIALSPHYRKWRLKMSLRDDRFRADIFHKK